MEQSWFDKIPLLVLVALIVLIVLAAIQIGHFLGDFRRKRAADEPAEPIGSVVGAMLGLLAFILAFTFGISATRFDTRKLLLLEEVNAIETTYLRAGLLPGPHGDDIRTLLRKYVGIRAAIFSMSPEELDEAIIDSERIQRQLWSQAELLVPADVDSELRSLFVSSLNEVLDLHTARTTTRQYRIPQAIWVGLLSVTVLSMAAVGYQFGLAGRSAYIMQVVLALCFAAVVGLIADLDRPTQGTLRVSQQPMIDLVHRLESPAP